MGWPSNALARSGPSDWWGLSVSGVLTLKRYGMMRAVGLKTDRTSEARRLLRRERIPWRRGFDAGELTSGWRGRAVAVLEVVDDDESNGGRGSVWGGRNRRRRAGVLAGLRRRIGLLRRPMWMGEEWRMLRRKRGSEECVEFGSGGALFMEARRSAEVRRGRAWSGRSGARRGKATCALGRWRLGDARACAS
jgi:hypothetical protein